MQPTILIINSITDTCHHRQWCTFSSQRPFLHKEHKILANFCKFVVDSHNCWCTFTGLNNALVPQNWHISSMLYPLEPGNFFRTVKVPIKGLKVKKIDQIYSVWLNFYASIYWRKYFERTISPMPLCFLSEFHGFPICGTWVVERFPVRRSQDKFPRRKCGKT